MKQHHSIRTIFLLAFLAIASSFCRPSSAYGGAVIFLPAEGSPLETFAGRETQRYLYLRTGELVPIVREATGTSLIIIASKDRLEKAGFSHDPAVRAILEGLGEQDYFLKSVDLPKGGRAVHIVGGSETSTLYGVYRFAEIMGIRFYLDGDVVPDRQVDLELPDVNEKGSPLFELRGIQPFHDFPEGPDWWSTDDYKAIIAQLPKLRMNWIGLHTYPNVEPTVWIGQKEDVASDGSVKFSYPTRYYNTALDVGWGFAAKKTSEYGCGAAALYDRDDYTSDIMRGLAPQPTTPEGNNEVFNRVGDMFEEAFTLAHRLGVKTCIGTETPLTVPAPVRERVGEISDLVQEMYAGIFTRIMRKHPLDYYWFWTPEGWTWSGTTREQVDATVQDILAAHSAAQQLKTPFQLATCGWVLGPQFDRAYLGKALPEDISVSCINREVGHEPVEPAFAEIEGRGKWAIPWLEDDPAMTSTQLWVRRMRRDARDALKYGCNGLMGIHWRTRILGPNVSALAHAAWDQEGWSEIKIERSGPIGGKVAASQVEEVTGTADAPPYRTVRFGLRGYALLVPNGSYTVTLKFCEIHHTEKGKRVFGVKLEGRQVIQNLDIFAEVGRNHALDRMVENVAVQDGVLDIEFTQEVENPCISAIVVEGDAFTQKIDCGGEAYQDYQADPEPLDLDPPADDFYLDWASHEFGPEVGERAAGILAKVDGKLPRPSDWINGPGGYRPDDRPWQEVEKDYAFVDELAGLRDEVEGSGSRDRFDYWLNNFQFLRATGKMKCAWGAYNQALKSASEETKTEERARLFRESVLPLREKLVEVVEEAYDHLLATVNTHGAMGTVCNLEQHTFPKMLVESGEELEGFLGQPLPSNARLSGEYAGEPRLIVPTIRTCLVEGEPLRITAVLLDGQPAREGRLYYRTLGKGDFLETRLGTPSRSTFTVEIPSGRIGPGGIEYYLEVVTAGGKTLRWPATGGEINQTVAVMPR